MTLAASEVDETIQKFGEKIIHSGLWSSRDNIFAMMCWVRMVLIPMASLLMTGQLTIPTMGYTLPHAGFYPDKVSY